ncbi:MAG: CRISPR system precrRNA processing endoribonuclease RAMP protein Cas6, partial [Actinobacteria bacterium]|nr:CRISPR system precrRNA processing endoribonuclease RAMP protein Cas6 [Actinomycetota bacterium]
LTEVVPYEDGSSIEVRRNEEWTDLLAASTSARYLPFEMLSPTAFRNGRLADPVPTATRVFGSLLDRWRRFGPDDLQPAIDLRSCELVTSFMSGRTETVHLLNKRWPGFVGKVTIHAAGGDPRDWRVLDALARLAVYSGIGTSTTFGMGQARYMPEHRRARDDAAGHDRSSTL